MADVMQIKTRRLTRAQLAQFLPTHELIKAFENLVSDVVETIPGNADELTISIEVAQEVADTAQSMATIAAGLAQAALSAVQALGDGPPPMPQHPHEQDDGAQAQIHVLREQLATLTRRVADLEERPTP